MTRRVADQVSTLEWHNALAASREGCARVFRDGGVPADALVAYGVARQDEVNWTQAVELIAQELCQQPFRHAA
jgi:hypothetical protein